MSEPAELQELAWRSFWGKPLVIERLHGSLHANLHLPPQGDSKLPAVLLLHGFGGSRHEHGGLFLKLASALALAGFAVLRFDFRSCGETGGDSQHISLETQVQDADDAFEHLAQMPEIDSKRIAVLGLSFGGLTAACLAGKRNDVAALVLWEAVFDMKATMKRIYGPTALRAVRARGYMQAGLIRLSPQFFEHLDKLDIARSVTGYDKPVLVVQGIEDTVVPVDTAFEWKRTFVLTEPEVALIPEADHAFTHDKWAWPVIERTVDWLKTKLL
jgi:uncharacterized protein